MNTRLSYIASAINGNKTIRIKYTKYDGTTSIRTISDIITLKNLEVII